MNGEVFLEGQSLLTGGIYVNPGAKLEEKTITENGTYYPSANKDGFSKVVVNVPQPQPVLASINIEENGTYTPPEGTDGYNNIKVEVPQPQPVYETLNETITENGEYTYTPSSGKDAFSSATINVNVDTHDNYVQTPRYIAYKEASMNIAYNYDNIAITYTNGVQLGCSLNGIVNLSGKNFTKLKYKITTGDCYDHMNSQNVRPFIIGITNQVRTAYVYASQTTAPNFFTAYNVHDVNDINKTITGEIDISNITGDMYLLVVATGWNVTIDNIILE